MAAVTIDGWRLHPPKAKRAANRDLWKRLSDARRRHEVTFRWVKCHSDVAENERCDRLSVQAAQHSDLAIDEVYERENPSLRPLETIDYQPPPGAPKKVTKVGHPCRKCGHSVEKRTPQKRRKTGQNYYYAYYLWCSVCRTMYLVDDVKRAME